MRIYIVVLIPFGNGACWTDFANVSFKQEGLNPLR